MKGVIMLGENIRNARTRRGLTIKELAAKVNVKHNVIRDMELKGSLPRNVDITELLSAISRATDTAITFLVTGKTVQNSAVASECENIIKSANKIIKSL
jgi:transcriptional regulator with XRE-family HTH domain